MQRQSLGFAMFAVGIAPTPELGAAVRAHVELVQAALAEWDAGRDYLNFTERRERGDRLFGAVAHRRLQAVKARVDPDDVFRSNHPIRLPATRLTDEATLVYAALTASQSAAARNAS